MKNRKVALSKIFSAYDTWLYVTSIITSLCQFDHINIKSRIWKVDDPIYKIKALNTFLTDLIKDNSFNQYELIQLKKTITDIMLHFITDSLFMNYFEYPDYEDYDCTVYAKTYSFNKMFQYWYSISGITKPLNEYLLDIKIKYINEVFYNMNQSDFTEEGKYKVPLYYGLFQSNIDDMKYNKKISSQFVGISVENILRFLIEGISHIIYKNRKDVNKSVIVYNTTDETQYFSILFDFNRYIRYIELLDYRITKEMIIDSKDRDEDFETEIQFYNEHLNLPYIFKLFERKESESDVINNNM